MHAVSAAEKLEHKTAANVKLTDETVTGILLAHLVRTAALPSLLAIGRETTLTPGNAGSFASPDWIGKLRYACPRCRAPIDPPHGAVAPKCARCGFQSTQAGGIVGFIPGTATYEWQEFYEAKAAGQNADTNRGVGYSSALQHRYMIEGFRRMCGEPPIGAAILDVGCGNGLFWRGLLGDRPVVGVDFSLRMCILAQAKGMLAYHADARALPFADDQFDLIYSAEVLQHITNHHALVTELARVCRPGGRIVVSTLNGPSWYRRAFFFLRGFIPRPNAPRHSHAIMRTAAELAASARAQSLSATRTCWTHYPLPWTHCATTTRYALEPLASNVIIELVKPAK
jgi:ubiquinone/menaquinone biosynthesis C-methylase UbiE